MSTNDVPGHNPANADELAMGCWAEHQDGSLMLVQSTENNRVIYEMFDMSAKPPIAYRDSMAEVSFKSTYSWGAGARDRWTWHDKTQFPWQRVIDAGVADGPRPVSAEAQMTAAQRVAESLRLRGRRLDAGDLGHMRDTFVRTVDGIWGGIKRALHDMERRD